MRIYRMVLAGITIAAFGAVTGRADVYQIDDGGAVQVRPVAGAVQWVAPGDAQAGKAKNDAATDDASGLPEAALTLVGTPSVPEPWRASLVAAAARYGISSDLLAALVSQESGWHPAATSAKGAKGLAQLMPATARAMAVDARDPAANLAGGAQYLRRMLDTFDGDIERALAAYNAGPARCTRAYVSHILLRLSPADAGPTGLPR